MIMHSAITFYIIATMIFCGGVAAITWLSFSIIWLIEYIITSMKWLYRTKTVDVVEAIIAGIVFGSALVLAIRGINEIAIDLCNQWLR